MAAEINVNNNIYNTLENEIRAYVEKLSYWEKYLANVILSGNTVTDNELNLSYSYLLEELQLNDETVKNDIIIDIDKNKSSEYKSNLFFAKLENVEGVNALVENQILEFNPKLTIIYGINGSGKSGYVRLFKDVFYSKEKERILSNIHNESENKPLNANFTFQSDNVDIPFTYNDKEKSVFMQFSVFDGKCGLIHLEKNNEFEFRPAGLKFFSDYSKAINNVEQILKNDISLKQSDNTAIEISDLFEGNSEIKTFIQGINSKTTIEEMDKYIPFSNEDKIYKENINKQYEELYLTLKGKEKEISNLENINRLLLECKQSMN